MNAMWRFKRVLPFDTTKLIPSEKLAIFGKSTLSVSKNTAPPVKAERNVSHPIFSEQVVVSPWHWAAFLGAGMLVPVGVVIGAWLLPTPIEPDLPPMEVVLSDPPAPQPPPQNAVQALPRDDNMQTPSFIKQRMDLPATNTRARAARILAASPSAPSAAADHADSFVAGESDSYAGGATVSSGTSDKAVENAPEPSPEPPPSPSPAAPSADAVAETRRYLGRIRDLLARHKRYPIAAQRSGIEGTVVVSLIIQADGSFGQVRVASSSGNDLLDNAAIASVSSMSGKIKRPIETGTSAMPLKTALRFEIAR